MGISGSYNDSASSGANNSGNVNNNYAAPTHPAFPFGSPASAGGMPWGLSVGVLLAFAGGLAVLYMASRGGGNGQ